MTSTTPPAPTPPGRHAPTPAAPLAVPPLQPAANPPTDDTGKLPGTSKDAATDRRPRRLLVVVLAAQFMALLDTFIVNVAAPTIRAELGTSGAGLQLVVAGYTVAYAVLLITGARLGGLFGHGRAHLAGLALFTAASLACGLASGTGQLIAFRLLQGVGAAVMIPQVLSLIQHHFTGRSRTRALGAYAAVLAVGAAAGQVVGGVLVSADLFGASWRPVFLVNVPIGLLLLVLGARLLPREPRTAESRVRARARGLDLPGTVLLAAAVTLFTVPLVLGQELGRSLWFWACLAGSAVFLAGFVAYEGRLAARGGAPLIAPRVLRIPGLARAALRIVLIMALNAGFLFVGTLHLQGGLGHSALRTGLMFGASAMTFGVVALTWRRWPAAMRKGLIPAGFVLVALATAAAGLLLRDGSDGGLALYAAFAASGAGLSLGFSPTLTGALVTVRPEDAADASGVLVTVTQLGQLIGVATFGTLYLERLGRFDAGGAHASARALAVCAVAIVAVALAGAATGLGGRRGGERRRAG